MAKLSSPLIVYLPDTRGVEVSRYGKGNLKIGPSVYTFSRLAGRDGGTCPGSTEECEACCYAKRIEGVIKENYVRNAGDDVPEIPADAKLLRIHVSGDFDTNEYIYNWIARLIERPDVQAWAYTRSWRVPELLTALEALRRLPNIQLFASMDKSHADVPPSGCTCGHDMIKGTTATSGGNHSDACLINHPWRRAWIDGDERAGDPQLVKAHMDDPVTHNLTTFDGRANYVCPEETKRVKDCESCGYCINGAKNDVHFLLH